MEGMEPHKKKSKGGYTDNPGPEDEESGREETGKRGAARKEAAKRMRSSDGAPTIMVSIFTGESPEMHKRDDKSNMAKPGHAKGSDKGGPGEVPEKDASSEGQELPRPKKKKGY